MTGPEQWQRAQPQHVDDIVALVDHNYSGEIDSVIFKKNPTRLAYHLHAATLRQLYLPDQVFVSVYYHDNQLWAWSWLERGHYTVYADQEMAVGEFIHVDLALPVRTRYRLVSQALQSWQLWCEINQIPVLCSTTMRENQAGFLRIHEQQGFITRGSFAYKKIGESKCEQ